MASRLWSSTPFPHDGLPPHPRRRLPPRSRRLVWSPPTIPLRVVGYSVCPFSVISGGVGHEQFGAEAFVVDLCVRVCRLRSRTIRTRVYVLGEFTCRFHRLFRVSLEVFDHDPYVLGVRRALDFFQTPPKLHLFPPSQISKHDKIGVALMFLGAVFVVSGAPVVDPPSGDVYPDLDRLFIDYLFAGSFVVTAFVIGALMLWVHLLIARYNNLDKASQQRNNKEVPAIGGTFLSGVYSGWTVTFFRCVSLILKDMIGNGRGDHALDYPFWFFGFLAFVTGGRIF